MPLLDFAVPQTLSLAYADSNTPVHFSPSTGTTTQVNDLISAAVGLYQNFAASGLAPSSALEVFFSNHQLVEIRDGFLDMRWTQLPSIFGKIRVVTFNGLPWQVRFFGPQDQYLGTATLASNGSGESSVVLTNASGQVVASQSV